MEIDNAIFQDLRSFGKGMFFRMAMNKFLVFFLDKHYLIAAFLMNSSVFS